MLWGIGTVKPVHECPPFSVIFALKSKVTTRKIKQKGVKSRGFGKFLPSSLCFSAKYTKNSHIIDEYDTHRFNRGHSCKFLFRSIVNFMTKFLSGGLKDNPHLKHLVS